MFRFFAHFVKTFVQRKNIVILLEKSQLLIEACNALRYV